MAVIPPPDGRPMHPHKNEENESLVHTSKPGQGLQEKPSPAEIEERNKLVEKMKAAYEKAKLEAEQKYAKLSPEEKKAKDFSDKVLLKRMNNIPLTPEELKWQHDTLKPEFKAFMLKSPYPVKGKK